MFLTDLCTVCISHAEVLEKKVTKNDLVPSNEQDMLGNLYETVFNTRRRSREKIECSGDLGATSFFFIGRDNQSGGKLLSEVGLSKDVVSK